MRLLFVEDNATNRTVVRHMMDMAGVEMAEAEEAETGLAMIEREDFDLVLMDLRMPGMDGLTAIRHIRSRGDHKANVPVIVVTADNTPDIRQSCLEAGADDLVMKPISLPSLFEAIGRVLSSSDGARAVLR